MVFEFSNFKNVIKNACYEWISRSQYGGVLINNSYTPIDQYQKCHNP